MLKLWFSRYSRTLSVASRTVPKWKKQRLVLFSDHFTYVFSSEDYKTKGAGPRTNQRWVLMWLEHHIFTSMHFQQGCGARIKFILSEQCLKVSNVIEDHNHDINKVNKHLSILINWELYLIVWTGNLWPFVPSKKTWSWRESRSSKDYRDESK